MTAIESLYLPRIARCRDLVEGAAILKKVLDPTADPLTLERFLIEYCSLGVQITQPVEEWIRRAGVRCMEVGLPEVGKALIDHASHEAGHHLMFINDTRKLAAFWNARRTRSLDSEALMARPATRAMRQYIALHEETIRGAAPYCQVAIELEIERLSVVLVPQLLAQVKRALGEQVVSSLTFLKSHGELDIGHTHLNSRIMESLLGRLPQAAADLALVGAEAMFIYMAIFDECWEAALDDCAGRNSTLPRLTDSTGMVYGDASVSEHV